MPVAVRTEVPVGPLVPSVLNPLPLTAVHADGGFWGRVQRLNRDAIIPHCDFSLERVGWIGNFRAAAQGTLGTDRVGKLFTDSELYKTMEAMAWENSRTPSPELEERLEAMARLVAGAQSPDGYVNTYFGYEGGPDRYSDLDGGHELYCAGHLIQAAVAMIRAGGPESFVETARRLADHICETFGPDGIQGIDGHPEIETALVELYRATGERRYLDQAKLFVDRRGHQTLSDTFFRGRDYYQDGVPIRQAKVLVGHAVRALYLTAGAIDVAVETGDDELLAAVKGQYDRTLRRRTYLTGGMGSNHHGESFGDDFELPSERAYAETCAAVASIHVAWRLLLATGEERYADVIERTVYNSVLSAPSVDGTTFFYVNALQRRELSREPEPGGLSLRRTDGQRASWFTTSCCPTNFARLFASFTGYATTVTSDGIQLHQYVAGTVAFEVDDVPVRLRVETAYPADGTVRVVVEETGSSEWELGLRIPEWATEADVSIGGESAVAAQPGLFRARRSWQEGDVVTLTIPFTPRVVRADPRVDALRGQFAVERGPLVYCVESTDQPGCDLDTILVDADGLVDGPSLDGMLDLPSIHANAISFSVPDEEWPYLEEPGARRGDPVALTLIPYFLWANRGLSTMRVWLPEHVERP